MASLFETYRDEALDLYRAEIVDKMSAREVRHCRFDLKGYVSDFEGLYDTRELKLVAEMAEKSGDECPVCLEKYDKTGTMCNWREPVVNCKYIDLPLFGNECMHSICHTCLVQICRQKACCRAGLRDGDMFRRVCIRCPLCRGIVLKYWPPCEVDIEVCDNCREIGLETDYSDDEE